MILINAKEAIVLKQLLTKREFTVFKYHREITKQQQRENFFFKKTPNL